MDRKRLPRRCRANMNGSGRNDAGLRSRCKLEAGQYPLWSLWNFDLRC